MRVKIKRFLGILIALPILAGLFCGVVEAKEAPCDSKKSCEESLKIYQEKYDEVAALQRAFVDCWQQENRGGEADWWGDFFTYKRGKKENCDLIYDEASLRTDETVLGKINEELKQERKVMGSGITSLQIYLHSFEEVDVKKSILAITDQNPFSDAESFLDGVIDLLVKMVGVAALVFLVIGGFRLVVAAGNDNEIQKAKSMILYAVIGLTVALLAYLIVAAVQGILYR